MTNQTARPPRSTEKEYCIITIQSSTWNASILNVSLLGLILFEGRLNVGCKKMLIVGAFIQNQMKTPKHKHFCKLGCNIAHCLMDLRVRGLNLWISITEIIYCSLISLQSCFLFRGGLELVACAWHGQVILCWVYVCLLQTLQESGQCIMHYRSTKESICLEARLNISARI